MSIKEFKEKLSQSNISTGAKKVALTIAIAGCLMVPMTEIAHAAVPASNILGDAQIQEDRSAIKMEDATSINGLFCGFDRKGTPLVSTEDITRAIELSNALNSYYFDELYFTNTNRSEVLGLNIEDTYEDYQRATYRGRTERFCQDNMSQKPAIDAYITFSCGTVANGIKDALLNRVCEVLTDEGYEITSSPRLTINNGKLYAIVELSNNVRVIEIKGEQVPSLLSTCAALNTTYNKSINNIAGTTTEYEGSFAYNGVDKYTNESVWLSLPDQNKKTNLQNGITLYESLLTKEAIILEGEDPRDTQELSRKERQMLESLGYTSRQIRNADKTETTLTILTKDYTK